MFLDAIITEKLRSRAQPIADIDELHHRDDSGTSPIAAFTHSSHGAIPSKSTRHWLLRQQMGHP